jgi:hypothetical protein
MRFRTYAALIAMALGAIWIAAQPAAAAECGAANQPPCPIKRAKPAAQQPAAPRRAAATPSRDPVQDGPASPPVSTEAVDIMLTKVPDIIVAEPNGHAQAPGAWREGNATAEDASSPPPPPVQQPPQPPQMRRHGPED